VITTKGIKPMPTITNGVKPNGVKRQAERRQACSTTPAVDAANCKPTAAATSMPFAPVSATDSTDGSGDRIVAKKRRNHRGNRKRKSRGNKSCINSPVSASTAYYQWFVLDTLGVAHNVSSEQLEHENIGGVYGGSILSALIGHASSIPVGVDENDCVWLLDHDNDTIPRPVAWGR